MTSYVQVMTTTDSQPSAEKIARELVDRRVAACVHIDGPLQSVYRWQGQIESATEWRCTAKTASHKYARVEAAIRELHPYDEPEILAVRIETGSPSYLAWLQAQIE